MKSMEKVKNFFTGFSLAAVVLALASYAIYDIVRPSIYHQPRTQVLGKKAETKPQSHQPKSCTTIQDGVLLTSDGEVIMPGYDQWGYNYQAHIFNGGYCDAYRNADWCQPYKDTELAMKWNDAWLSNKDCDQDERLDRHYGYPSYIGSGAWLTNHMKGEYEEDGTVCKWNYFVKIAAVPADASLRGGYWYSADGEEIGPAIWGSFAIIQEVENDPCAGLHGAQYISPVGPGFGQFRPQ